MLLLSTNTYTERRCLDIELNTSLIKYPTTSPLIVIKFL